MTGFGEQLRELRKAAGLTQEQLAGVTGVTNSYISALENSKKPAPPRAIVALLAANLNADETRLWRVAQAERESRLRERIDGVPTSMKAHGLQSSEIGESQLSPDLAHDKRELGHLVCELSQLADNRQERDRLVSLLETILGWLRGGG